MLSEGIQRIVDRAKTDPTLQNSLIADPSKALADANIQVEEADMATLSTMSQQDRKKIFSTPFGSQNRG
jgi:hypothetical protein